MSSRYLPVVFGGVLLLGVLTLAWSQTQPAAPPVATVNKPAELKPAVRAQDDIPLTKRTQFTTKRDQAIWDALEQKLTISFDEVLLREVCEKLSQQTKLNIQIDKKALDDATYDFESKHVAQYIDLPLRSILRHLLKTYDLSYIIKDGMLLITTKTAQEADYYVMVYDVQEIIGGPEDDLHDYVALIYAITSTVEPTRWQTNGGAYSIVALEPSLLIMNASQETHELVHLFFEDIVRAKELQRTKQPPQSATPAQPAAQKLQRVVYHLLPPRTAKEIANETEPDNAVRSELARFVNDGANPEQLTNLIKALIQPESWQAKSGPSIHLGPNSLIVMQSAPVHRQIKKLLRELSVLNEISGLDQFLLKYRASGVF